MMHAQTTMMDTFVCSIIGFILLLEVIRTPISLFHQAPPIYYRSSTSKKSLLIRDTSIAVLLLRENALKTKGGIFL